MRKIPTLFERDWDGDRRYVLPKVVAGCEWVIDGEGVPTRKYDGTCVMRAPGKRPGLVPRSYDWWFRREVKRGKTPPDDYLEIGFDEETGKSVGWEPAVEGHPFLKFLDEALMRPEDFPPGTYELIGPKINGNPEGAKAHVLVAHAAAEVLDAPRDFDRLAEWLHANPYEGIVWHHPDGRMAKIKKRDFADTGALNVPPEWESRALCLVNAIRRLNPCFLPMVLARASRLF